MKDLFAKLVLGFAGLILFAVFFLIGASLTHSMPSILLVTTGINRWEYQPREQTVLYYSDGQEMSRIGYKRVYSEDYPEFLKEAVVAVEDRRFYQHSGLDARGIGRAIWKNIRAGDKVEGGSTITQQLARTLFLSQEKTYSRKVKEVFIAVSLEEKYGKEAILNMYLNEIYMGRGCAGMASASWSYFNKDIFSLNKAEICMLVGMIQAPEYYSPDRNFEELKKRQETVVDILVSQGLISADQGETIKQQPLYIEEFKTEQKRHPYFMAYVTQQLQEMLGTARLYQGGFKIYTSLDRRMQEAAEKTVIKHVRSIEYRGISASDIALVSVDPYTGGIKALVGGVDYERNQVNMAVAPRQPGSAIKPLYYAAAINEGIIELDTVVNNKPRDFGGYCPQNYAPAPEKVTAREALVNSYNVASVEILNRLGIEKACNYLERLGISPIDKEDKNLALALGGMSKGVSLLQMTAAFAVFPNRGEYHPYYVVERIEDYTGKMIYKNKVRSERVISSNTALLMDDVLKDVVRYGTGKNAAIAIRSGGKTGTTSASRDLWYVGYIQELVTAVWVGNSDGSEVKGYGGFGGTVSAPIWRDYMNILYYGWVLKERPVLQVPEDGRINQQPAENGETSPEDQPDNKQEEATEEQELPPDEEPVESEEEEDIKPPTSTVDEAQSEGLEEPEKEKNTGASIPKEEDKAKAE